MYNLILTITFRITNIICNSNKSPHDELFLHINLSFMKSQFSILIPKSSYLPKPFFSNYIKFAKLTIISQFVFATSPTKNTTDIEW